MAENNKDNGWVLIYRSIQDNPMWSQKPFSKGQAWIDLILLAKYRDEKFVSKRGEMVDGKRGTVYLSIQALSQRWGWSRTKVDRFLNQLCKEDMVKVCKSRACGRTSITIVNYSKYQDKRATKKTSREHVANMSRASREHIQRKSKEGLKKEERKAAALPADADAVAEDPDDDCEDPMVVWEKWKAEQEEEENGDI